MTPYYTAFAYRTDDGATRRAGRRFHDPECARRAAERLAPPDADDPWEWGTRERGWDADPNNRPTDERAFRAAGDWELVVRKHRAPNLRRAIARADEAIIDSIRRGHPVPPAWADDPEAIAARAEWLANNPE